MLLFNLSEALAGKSLITRHGEAVKKFKSCKPGSEYFKFSYQVGNNSVWCNENGRVYADRKSGDDLFMQEDIIDQVLEQYSNARMRYQESIGETEKWKYETDRLYEQLCNMREEE